MDKYPERWVRGECVNLYGAPISRTQWSKYKDICRVPDLRSQCHKGTDNLIPKTNCLWLLCLAYLKGEKYRQWEYNQQLKLQRHDISWDEKQRIMSALKTRHIAGKQSKVDLSDVITTLNSPVTFRLGLTCKEALEEALGHSVELGVMGRDIPDWIEKQTGRRLDLSTFQRQAKKHGMKFSLSKPVPPETLDLFLDLYWVAASA